METVELLELYKLFNEDYIDNNLVDGSIRMNVAESNVNVVRINIVKAESEISQDILNRLVKILKNTNTLSVKYAKSYDDVWINIFCKSDPTLEKIVCVFNVIREYQASNILLEKIATLGTIKNIKKEFVGIPSPTNLYDFEEPRVISTIDETKPIDKDIDIINLLKSNIDFDIKYDYRDIGHVLSYITCNRHIYDQPTISREDAYKSYVDFCNRNYLKTIFSKHIFGKRIKKLCNTRQKFVDNKRVRSYYLSNIGNSCIDDPEIYYGLIKKETGIKDSNNITYSESFDRYFAENRDSYKDYIFTKFEAYEDYEDFCITNSYQPLLRNDFYRLMLKECVVKTSEEKNGSECFIIESYAYVRKGGNVAYSKEATERIENRNDNNDTQTPNLEDGVKAFVKRYRDVLRAYNFMRSEAFETYKECCDRNNEESMGKITFYKEMRKYCIECRHRPSPKDDPRTYFVIQSDVITSGL